MSLYWSVRGLWQERVTNRPRHTWSRQQLERYQVRFEVLDAHGRPAPPGVTGDRLVITNLINSALPLIRYEMGDRLQLKPALANACGTPWRQVAAIDGRADDMLTLPNVHGAAVPLPPIGFTIHMMNVQGAGPFQVVLTDGTLHVTVQPEAGADRERLPGQVSRVIQSWLESLAVVPLPIRVTLVDSIPRSAGKIKMVRKANP